MFTATPREDLDELARTQRLKDEAFALQLRAIVRLVTRARAPEREFAADEVALALNISPTSGAMLAALAIAASTWTGSPGGSAGPAGASPEDPHAPDPLMTRAVR